MSFRRFRDDRDHTHLAEIMNQSWAGDGVQKCQTPDRVAAQYKPAEAFDPRTDIVVAELPDGPIGFSRIRHGRENGGARIYYVAGHVLPAWRRRGIGDALLGHAERRLREIAATHPDDGPKLFESTVLSGQLGGRALMDIHGYRPTPELELQDMLRPSLDDAPTAELPAGLEVRPVGAEHWRQIWRLFQTADLDGPGSLDSGEDEYQRWAAMPFWDDSLWQIAWDGEEPVGMVLNFIEKEENARFGLQRGYTEWINVARRWRRRSLARALIVRSFGVLKDRGMREAALDVYVHNPTGARALYESLGYRRVRSLFCYRKPL